MSVPVEALVIGAGHRGRDTFGAFARSHSEDLRIVGVAEPDAERRALFAGQHGLEPGQVTADWRDLLARPQQCPVAIVATQDEAHVEPALAAIAAGYHVLLEKPMAVTAPDCVRLIVAAEDAGVLLQIGHVLRYTQFYAKVHELVAGGAIGDLMTIDMCENVAFWHYTHSYVRGKWRLVPPSAPMIMAKSCHDLDLMAWFAGATCATVASFGDNRHFTPEHAPHPDVPARCTDGCPVQAECPHDAVRFYVNETDFWPWRDVSLEATEAARRAAIETGPYGKCVYHTDKNTVDHQVVSAGFANGVTATFTMQGFATYPARTLRLSGTEGDIRGTFEKRRLHLCTHHTGRTERIQAGEAIFGHSDGDEGLIGHFVDVVRRNARDDVLASGRVSLESHLMGFAAEDARLGGKLIDMNAYRTQLESHVRAAGANGP